MGKISKIDQIIKLTQCGWRAYEGQASGAVYDNLECDQKQRGRARWFAKGDLLICVGCGRACTLPCPEGFQLPLFKYPHPPSPVFRLSPDELLSKRKLLQIHEVAYVLNVSNRHVRRMIQSGRLLATKDKPLRVLVDEVRAKLNDVDVWTPDSELELDERALAMNDSD